MRKTIEENERMRCRYLQYLKTAHRKDPSTAQKATEGILRFEDSTNFTSFKAFDIELAIKFHDHINAEIRKATGKIFPGCRPSWPLLELFEFPNPPVDRALKAVGSQDAKKWTAQDCLEGGRHLHVL